MTGNDMTEYSRRHFLPGTLLGLIAIFCFTFAWQGNTLTAEAAETISLPAQAVAPGEATLTVNLKLPEGCKLNQETPSTVGLKSSDAAVVTLDPQYAKDVPVANLPLVLTVPVKKGKSTLQATYRLNFCDEKLGVCFFKEAVLTLPVEVKKSTKNKKLAIEYKVQLK
jgi:hypothetical protein